MDIDVTADPLAYPTETDSTTRTSTSGGRVMSKASGQAIADELAANQAQAQAQQSVGDAEALAAQQKVDQQAIASDQAHQQAADQAAEHQFFIDKQNAAREAAANAEEKFANHKFEDYWSHQSKAKRIASFFSLFGGGTGAAYLGIQNPAALALNRAMDQDFATQKMQLDQKREAARMAGANVNDLYTQEGHENAALAIKHAKANEATAASMVQAMTEAGIPVDQAKNNTIVQGLLARGQEKRREALQHYDRTFSNATAQKEVTGGAGAGSVAQQRLELQRQKLVVRDPNTGEPMGMAPTGEIAGKLGDTMAKLDTYQEAAGKLADHLETHGHLLNPMSTEYKVRQNLVADVQAMGRAVKGIQATDAGQKLEHMIIGGSGTGLERSADPQVLRGLAVQARKQTEQRLRSTLAPMPGQAASRSPSQGDAAPDGGAPPPAPKPAKPARVPGADLVQMRKAHRAGDTRFDEILAANGML